MKILIIEDEQLLADSIAEVLRRKGFEAEAVYDGETGAEYAELGVYDLLILDVMMPGLSGYEVTRALRRFSEMPILILSAKSEDNDKILGLNLGADDYVTKPFRPVVLGAKVKALLRRSREFSSAASQQLRCGPFRYDGATMRFFKGEEVLDLSSREGALLLLFLQHPNQVFTKDMLYERVWGTAVAVDDNAIMVYINRLRGKIEPDRQHPVHIRTVRGLGYRFVP